MEATDYLVIGAGPAGLQTGYFLEQAGRDYLIAEEGDGPGTFFRTFPRHRTMISNNKVHTGWDDPELNLRMDWNSLLSDDPQLLFTKYTPHYFPPADDWVRYLEDFAESWKLRVRYGSRVVRIARPEPDGPFTATDQAGRTVEAARIVVATGVSRPYLPDVPGIELVEPYATMTVDPEDFTDQRVLILGKGNSAFETAENLLEHAAVVHVAGPHPVKLAWRTHYVGHLRAVNNNFLDTYQLKSQNAILDGRIESVRRGEGGGLIAEVRFARAPETKHIPYDRILACTGFRFDASVFDSSCRPELVIDDRFPGQTSAFESVNVPGLYFAGTLNQVRDFKKGTNGFIHGFRYAVRALHRIMETRHHGEPWPHRTLPLEVDAVADAVLERVNRSSALWQQFTIMADVVTLPPAGSAEGCRYLEEVPVDYAREHAGEPEFGDRFLAVTLEYGPGHDKVDPFDFVERVTQSETVSQHEGRYLHPIVRLYQGGEPVAEHHITENLENEWHSERIHRAPLRAFLAETLAEAAR